MKKVINIIAFSFIIIFMNSAHVYAEEKKIIYFYSPTCSACAETEHFIEGNLKSDIQVARYDITEESGLKLFKSYCSTYLVPFDKQTVPAMFVGENFLIGKEEVVKAIKDDKIKKYSDKRLLEIDSKVFNNKVINEKMNSPLGIFYVFFSGLLDGFNPCAMAMLLMFISFLGFGAKKSTLINISVTYIFALFITYFALGTMLFNFLHLIHLEYIAPIVNTIVILLCFMLFILNIYDYIVSKNEHYEKIKLQLPKSIQKFNKKIISQAAEKIKRQSRMMYLVVFILGITIALTEFLCTGQIYLPVIISLIQFSNAFNLMNICYLLIYNFAFVVPLIVIAVIAIRTQSVMSTSDKIRSKLHLIKLFNSVFFFIIAIIFIFIKF